MGRDLCLRLSLCSCLRVAVEGRQALERRKYLSRVESLFAPRDPEDAMCGEVRDMGSALLEEEETDRLPVCQWDWVRMKSWLPVDGHDRSAGAANDEGPESERSDGGKAKRRLRAPVGRLAPRRTRDWVGRDKQPTQHPAELDDGKLNNTNKTTGLSWVSDGAEDVADAVNKKFKPRLEWRSGGLADATDETTVHSTKQTGSPDRQWQTVRMEGRDDQAARFVGR
ncbi:hypothetical protein CORC01_07697 [Colletotrichum orchidophilum]|uniref:Uncharacterized protein n=1 Tax=Colletotrichum orchidophilum TaxID=1209926 RepID=A0A1G4B6I8_9PEZI|nr:uncharacterized protein CORC01_07697 [Colletotrichum orchidophilum]OHE96912.1 hypothetical protein CORC01_07697 [Colletotrichum orchidophilum]